MKNQFYNPHEIAEMLGICYAKALEWIKFSGVKYIRIGRTYHVSIEEFKKYTGILE